ncbi:DUF6745 domain-containing protein, partial [Mycolicibacterium llatzerense]|uniref:DUF6745 domain-containing protein n=1 Tax=Mycolicibacterium llatzerense TaxID=280871 RepID=UPI003899439F
VRWSDGWGVYSWHGTQVPADMIDGDWSVERIMAETNTEIRRCAIEKSGWDAILAAMGEQPIDICADPAKPENLYQLYRVPDKVNPYGQAVNLLVMTNGSPDRSGTVRRYGETVPAHITSALSAAAWQFGVDPTVYATASRRT